jgi:hypothetical protein
VICLCRTRHLIADGGLSVVTCLRRSRAVVWSSWIQRRPDLLLANPLARSAGFVALVPMSLMVSRPFVVHLPPPLQPASSALGDGSRTKIIPCISRDRRSVWPGMTRLCAWCENRPCPGPPGCPRCPSPLAHRPDCDNGCLCGSEKCLSGRPDARGRVGRGEGCGSPVAAKASGRLEVAKCSGE